MFVFIIITDHVVHYSVDSGMSDSDPVQSDDHQTVVDHIKSRFPSAEFQVRDDRSPAWSYQI